MDVGSGAGLPGVVLAIAMPNAHVTCVDAVEKKISFIRQIKGILGLDNLESVHARVEDMEIQPSQVVISRAFSSMRDFVELAGKHVVQDGKIAAMKGKVPIDEMQELSKDEHWTIEKTVRLDVPELEAERCLVWIEKKGNT
jgi:16S rRNA (guanine527-N7)-methyltransferase